MAIVVGSQVNPPIPLVGGSSLSAVVNDGSDSPAVVINPGIGGKGRPGDPGPTGATGPRGPIGAVGSKSSTVVYMTQNVSNFPVLLLADNPARLGFLIENQGSVELYIGFSSDMQLGNLAQLKGGARLNQMGTFSTGLVNYTGPIYGMTPNSSTIVFVSEFTE